MRRTIKECGLCVWAPWPTLQQIHPGSPHFYIPWGLHRWPHSEVHLAPAGLCFWEAPDWLLVADRPAPARLPFTPQVASYLTTCVSKEQGAGLWLSSTSHLELHVKNLAGTFPPTAFPSTTEGDLLVWPLENNVPLVPTKMQRSKLSSRQATPAESLFLHLTLYDPVIIHYTTLYNASHLRVRWVQQSPLHRVDVGIQWGCDSKSCHLLGAHTHSVVLCHAGFAWGGLWFYFSSIT